MYRHEAGYSLMGLRVTMIQVPLHGNREELKDLNKLIKRNELACVRFTDITPWRVSPAVRWSCTNLFRSTKSATMFVQLFRLKQKDGVDGPLEGLQEALFGCCDSMNKETKT